MMIHHFKDVYSHMEWADSLIWNAVFESETVCEDAFILKSLFHLHEVQYAFLNSWTGKPMERYSQDVFENAAAMRDWGCAFHEDLHVHMQDLREEALGELHILPWTKYYARRLGREATDTTLAETMHQLGSHSMHHRGQVMRRFREMGVAPPGLDYIVWVWSGRPEPSWN